MATRTQQWILRLLALAGFALLAVYQFLAFSQTYERLRWPENQPDPGFSVTAPWPSVGRVSEVAIAAGLRPGEKVVQVQGQPYTGEAGRAAILEKLFPGDRITITVESPGAGVRDVSWPLAPVSSTEDLLGRMLILAVLALAMPALCLGIGFWTVFVRPLDRQAWLLLGMLITFSHAIVQPEYFRASLGSVGVMLRNCHWVLNMCWGLCMFLFAWYFPQQTKWQHRNRALLRVITAVLLAAAIVGTARHIAIDRGHGDLVNRLEPFAGAISFLQIAAITGFFTLLTYKRFTLSSTEAVRRLRIILLGALWSLTPVSLLVLASQLFRRAMGSFPEWLLLPALLAIGLFPVTLAYVIIVHRAFAIGVVIRQGLRYALAQRAVRILQLLLSIGILVTAVYLASQPGLNRARIIQTAALGAALVLLLQRAAEGLQRWLDRRFFRDASAAEQVLASLSEDVRTMIETRPLLEAVAARISQALHIDNVQLLLRDGQYFQPAFAAAGSGPCLPENATTARLLNRDRTPLRVYMEDRASWIHRERLPAAELDWLRDTGAELLLPLAGKEQLLGIVSLGPKRSEEPYSGADVRLLRSVAAQAGLALENSRLTAAVAEEVAQRELLHREVEIAREVQERLFPHSLPAVDGIDYGGVCRPALGIGGDCYDFLLLDNGQFAFSIGDVSGKGIPAALLMASLQSALRAQAISLPRDLGALMTAMNRVLHDSSPDNRYATLFYAQYDPATRQLTYVNGGHNAPFVIRNGQTHRLEDGGPVVGLLPSARYTQHTFAVQSGDILVGFTDGISEAMNAKDEEWGEEALETFLHRFSAPAASGYLPAIMQAADDFAAGAPQHDDMTLIVVRFL